VSDAYPDHPDKGVIARASRPADFYESLHPAFEPKDDPTQPWITSLHRHPGCGHDCLSGACGLTASKRDALCPYCELVIPDRRWSDGSKGF